MKIGVNYLLESKELFEEGKLDFIDFFKLYSLDEDLSGADWCIENKGFMFHGLVGDPSFFGDKDLIKKTKVKESKKLLNASIAPFISGHIISSEDNTLEGYLEVIKNNIKDFKKEFKKDIVLENTPYRAYRNSYQFFMDPAIISQIVYDNDIKFLFDISHARSAANHLGMTLDEYVAKLPMDRCVEVHMAGMFKYPDTSNFVEKAKYSQKQIDLINIEIKRYSSMVGDNHGKLSDDDYKFLAKLLKEYKGIEYITLEYGSVNDYIGFNDEDFLYPICNFKKVNEKAKEEVLEQLLKIKEVVDGKYENNGSEATQLQIEM